MSMYTLESFTGNRDSFKLLVSVLMSSHTEESITDNWDTLEVFVVVPMSMHTLESITNNNGVTPRAISHRPYVCTPEYLTNTVKD